GLIAMTMRAAVDLFFCARGRWGIIFVSLYFSGEVNDPFNRPSSLSLRSASPDTLRLYFAELHSVWLRHAEPKAKAGAARGTRTPDPVITNDVLYQLSYCGGPWKTR